MKRHKVVLQQSRSNALGHSKLTRQRRLIVITLIINLAQVTLACAFIGLRSPSISDRIAHLPTLTRTPLPTLTPTANATVVAAATSVIAETAIAPSTRAGVEPAEPTTAFGAAPINAPAASAQAIAVSKVTASLIPTSPLPSSPTVMPFPTSTPTTTAPQLPKPTSTATEVPTPTPLPVDWVFNGVWVFYDQDGGGLLLHGDVLNNTGASQELTAITGTFYDGQGQILLDGNTAGYWPIAAVSSGGRVPFELLAPGLQSAANFDLRVEAKPSNDPPRQDFEFLDVTPSTQDGNYCLTGKLRNIGGDLQSYLVIAAVLFDSQDNVLDYADYYEYYPKDLGNGQTRDFEICVDTLSQTVARYELRAWGL